ncbi:hypothetical protein ACJRO7_015922 [Eucalyptus globulus]|uniref:Strictosidine synthase conserved region domain-containing protein n=1 Tax=Eucalyptus globulus TaxID=34317 RepID=A0ABD3L5D2_EUCGL
MSFPVLKDSFKSSCMRTLPEVSGLTSITRPTCLTALRRMCSVFHSKEGEGKLGTGRKKASMIQWTKKKLHMQATARSREDYLKEQEIVLSSYYNNNNVEDTKKVYEFFTKPHKINVFTIIATYRFMDDVIEASHGSLYFSIASTNFDLHNWYLDLPEAEPRGQLLKFDPSSSQILIALDDLFFIFIDNLPDGPDNFNLAPEESFWIALQQLICEGWEFVHASKAAKHLIATYPSLIKKASGVYRRASVLHVGADGKIIKKLDDPDGKVISFVTSAFEF